MTRVIRSVAAVAVLGLMAVVAAWAVWAVYDLAAIYADPVAPAVATFGFFGFVAVIVLVILIGLGAAATALAITPLRRLVRGAAGVVVVAAVVGIVVANDLGVEAKRDETSKAPRCGIASPTLARQFAEIEHPGYFGGGTSSRTDCSYLLTTDDVYTALADYERGLRADGWSVSLVGQELTAERDQYGFRAVVEEPIRGDAYLTVSMRG